MESSFGLKEQIRDAIDIVDLVSRYIPSLRRQGRIYVGRCPWHDDSRPSLQVNPERQTFKCWVCNIGGDVFSFIMQMEGVDFKESLEILADMAGISLPEKNLFASKRNGRSGTKSSSRQESPSGRDDPITASDPNVYVPVEISKSVLYKSLEWLTEKYHSLFLNDPEAQGARDYIRDRGISDEMIRRFKIGYSPLHPKTLLELIGFDRNRVRILEAAGVLAARQDSLLESRGAGKSLSQVEIDATYDRFRGRVLFPIRDTQERTVAFGGRLLPDSPLNSPAKYVNSPETMIFTKSRMLYGLELARNAIRKKKRVVITEGYTDCLMAHQFGFDETVAVLGTALGEEHVRILNRFADKIILVLDGDAAGKKRADEVLGLFVAQGADMSILTLPDENDPCEYLLAHGADDFADQLENRSVDALDHAFHSATEGVDLTRDIVGASRALDRLLSIIALYPTKARSPGDPVRIRMTKMIQRLSERFRIDEREIRRRLRTHRERIAQTSSYAPHPETSLQSGVQEDFPSDFGSVDRKGDEEVGIRSEFIFPNAKFEDETDDVLAERFEKIPIDLWQTESLLPNRLESEFFEFWFTLPEMFAETIRNLTPDDFASPVSRQLVRLGLDLLARGESVAFESILLRYDHPKMTGFLVDLDAAAFEKNLRERLASEKNRQIYLKEILRGFERQRIAALEPGQISDLREESLNKDEKLQKLLELQKLLLKRQQQRDEQTDLMEEDGSSGG